jgi:hypothetical protein
VGLSVRLIKVTEEVLRGMYVDVGNGVLGKTWSVVGHGSR